MRSISENDLSAIIPLLAEKIRDLTLEIRDGDGREDDLSDEEFDARTDAQDMLVSYRGILDSLEEEYRAALDDGTILPAFEELVAPFATD